MPKPVDALPKISSDGAVIQSALTTPAPDTFLIPNAPRQAGGGAAPAQAALTPTRTEKLLFGRKYLA
jgi:penicillin-binding protein 2